MLYDNNNIQTHNFARSILSPHKCVQTSIPWTEAACHLGSGSLVIICANRSTDTSAVHFSSPYPPNFLPNLHLAFKRNRQWLPHTLVLYLAVLYKYVSARMGKKSWGSYLMDNARPKLSMIDNAFSSGVWVAFLLEFVLCTQIWNAFYLNQFGMSNNLHVQIVSLLFFILIMVSDVLLSSETMEITTEHYGYNLNA